MQKTLTVNSVFTDDPSLHKETIAIGIAIGAACGVVFLVTVVICIWRGLERTGKVLCV